MTSTTSPPRGGARRGAGRPRSIEHRYTVRLEASILRRVDAARGARSRLGYLREAIAAELARVGEGTRPVEPVAIAPEPRRVIGLKVPAEMRDAIEGLVARDRVGGVSELVRFATLRHLGGA